MGREAGCPPRRRPRGKSPSGRDYIHGSRPCARCGIPIVEDETHTGESMWKDSTYSEWCVRPDGTPWTGSIGDSPDHTPDLPA